MTEEEQNKIADWDEEKEPVCRCGKDYPHICKLKK